VPVDELMLHTPLVIRLPLLVTSHEVSVEENPEPEIATVIPIPPEVGVKEIVGPMRRKAAETIWPLSPVTVMICGPTLLLTMSKVPVKLPLVVTVMVQNC